MFKKISRVLDMFKITSSNSSKPYYTYEAVDAARRYRQLEEDGHVVSVNIYYYCSIEEAIKEIENPLSEPKFRDAYDAVAYACN
jgi:hypothetical protein